MRKIAILFAAAASTLAGLGTAAAQPVANEEIWRFYSDSGYQNQVGEFVANCDGTYMSWGMVTEHHTYEYFGCP